MTLAFLNHLPPLHFDAATIGLALVGGIFAFLAVSVVKEYARVWTRWVAWRLRAPDPELFDGGRASVGYISARGAWLRDRP